MRPKKGEKVTLTDEGIEDVLDPDGSQGLAQGGYCLVLTGPAFEGKG
jgi:hypothetical protein